MRFRTATFSLLQIGWSRIILLLVLMLVPTAAVPETATSPSARFLFKLPSKSRVFARHIWSAQGRLYYAVGYRGPKGRFFYHVNGRTYGPFIKQPHRKPYLAHKGVNWALRGRTKQGFVVIWNGQSLGPYLEYPWNLEVGRGFTAKTAPGRWIIRDMRREYGPYKVTPHRDAIEESPFLQFAPDGSWTATVMVREGRDRLLDNGRDLGVYDLLASFEKHSPSHRAFIGDRKDRGYAIIDGREFPLPPGAALVYGMRAPDRSHWAVVTLNGKGKARRSFAYLHRGRGPVKRLGPFATFPGVRTGPRGNLVIVDTRTKQRQLLFVNGNFHGEYQDVRDINFDSSGKHWTIQVKNAKGDFLLTDAGRFGPYTKIAATRILKRPGGGLSWALLVREKNGVRRIIVNGRRFGPFCSLQYNLSGPRPGERRFIEFSPDAKRWAFAAAMPMGTNMRKACAARSHHYTLFMNGRRYGSYARLRAFRWGPGAAWGFVAREFHRDASVLMANGKFRGRISDGPSPYFGVLPSGEPIGIETHLFAYEGHGQFVHYRGNVYGPFLFVLPSHVKGRFFEESPSGRVAFRAKDINSSKPLVVIDGVVHRRDARRLTWLQNAKRPGFYWFETRGRSVYLAHKP